MKNITKYSTWAEIDLQSIKHNLDNIKNKTNKKTKICGVVKANAYGHGIIEISKFLESQNVDYLSVARIEEAINIRSNNINLPILVLGYVCPENIEDAIKNNITICVYSLEIAQKIDNISNKLRRKIKVHIKVDTGMNRLGFNFQNIYEIQEVFKLDNIEVEGIFTHLATADEVDRTFSNLQNQRFKNLLGKLNLSKDIIVHLSNSANTYYLPDGEYDMVRCGIALYGCKPDESMPDNIDIKPALTLKCRVSNIKTIDSGDGISYGISYTAKQKEKIATITIGYADGFFRGQSNPQVIIKNEIFDVVGRICMDQCMVKIDKEIELKIGDEVTIFSSRNIKASDVAKRAGTISYEILTSLSHRVVRLYK
ncbi:MAG: alanine racemase [Peptostreptococcaceae bacterium]